MIRPAVYISEHKDIDLCGLLKEIGPSRFRKVAKLCIRGLFDEQSAEEAKELAQKNIKSDVFNLKENNGCYGIRLSFAGSKPVNRQSATLINSIKQSHTSFFIKTVMRQILGPQVLLKYFLKDGTATFYTKAVYVPVSYVDTYPTLNRRTPVKDKKEEENATVEDMVVEQATIAEQGKEVTSIQQVPVQSYDTSEVNSGTEDDLDILSMLEQML